MTDFEIFVTPIVGLSVSSVWRPIGSSIFLEFGGESPVADTPSGERRPGAFTLMIQSSWRIESQARVLAGSFSEDHVIEEMLYGCAGRRVESVELFGRLLEVKVALSGGRSVVSFTTTDGDPDWTLFDNRDGGSRWVHAIGGALAFDAREAGRAES